MLGRHERHGVDSQTMVTELTCIGRDGHARIFYLESPRDLTHGPLRFRVHINNPPEPGDDWFSITLVPFRDGLKIVEINHFGHEWYRAKGIGDTLLPEIHRLTQARIYSSSNEQREAADEFRSMPAGKLWLRLLLEDLASYDPDDDRFCLPPIPATTDKSTSQATTVHDLVPRSQKPLPVFPDITPTRIKTGRFRVILSDDIQTQEDLTALIHMLYDDPECNNYYYFEHKGRSNSLLLQAEHDQQIDLSEVEYFPYRRPVGSSGRNFLRIGPESLATARANPREREYYAWQKAIVAVGPMYGRVVLKLTTRMQREMEIMQGIEMSRAADTNPIKAEPTFFGFGLDLVKLRRFIRSKFQGRK